MSKDPTRTERDNAFAERIRNIEAQLDRLKVSQAPTIKNTNLAYSSLVPVANGAWAGITLSVNPLVNQTLIATIQVGIYRDDMSVGANEYPGGANWSSAEVMGSSFETWADYGSSDGKNLRQFLIFKNSSGGSISVIFLGNARVPQVTGA